jgi:hypothetical protein
MIRFNAIYFSCMFRQLLQLWQVLLIYFITHSVNSLVPFVGFSLAAHNHSLLTVLVLVLHEVLRLLSVNLLCARALSSRWSAPVFRLNASKR